MCSTFDQLRHRWKRLTRPVRWPALIARWRTTELGPDLADGIGPDEVLADMEARARRDELPVGLVGLVQAGDDAALVLLLLALRPAGLGHQAHTFRHALGPDVEAHVIALAWERIHRLPLDRDAHLARRLISQTRDGMRRAAYPRHHNREIPAATPSSAVATRLQPPPEFDRVDAAATVQRLVECGVIPQPVAPILASVAFDDCRLSELTATVGVSPTAAKKRLSRYRRTAVAAKVIEQLAA